jgi:hypothetical protein
MSTRQQATAAIRHAWQQARLHWRQSRRSGILNWFEDWKPASVTEQIAYRNGRGWVPEGHDGGLSDQFGVAYHTYWAVPAKYVLNFACWIVERPFRFFAASGLFALFVTAVCVVLSHYGAL